DGETRNQRPEKLAQEVGHLSLLSRPAVFASCSLALRIRAACHPGAGSQSPGKSIIGMSECDSHSRQDRTSGHIGSPTGRRVPRRLPAARSGRTMAFATLANSLEPAMIHPMIHPMIHLALDVGEKRIGVAVSDETGTLASPRTIIRRTSTTAALEGVAQL